MDKITDHFRSVNRPEQKKVAASNTNMCLFQSDLARIHNNIGDQLASLGRPSEALASVEKARAIRQALADADPRATTYQRDLAISLVEVGDLRQAAGKVNETAELYRKAIAILERLPQFSFGSSLIDSRTLARHP